MIDPTATAATIEKATSSVRADTAPSRDEE
jgi:hypothetical protein